MYGLKVLKFYNSGVHSPGYYLIWGQSPVVATCRMGSSLATWKRYATGNFHKAPDEDCNCGIHATFGLWPIYKYFGDVFQGHSPARFFLVLIEGGGKTVLHEDGFRCEVAHVSAVVQDTSFTAYPDAVRYFSVPLITTDEALEKTYAEHIRV